MEFDKGEDVAIALSEMILFERSTRCGADEYFPMEMACSARVLFIAASRRMLPSKVYIPLAWRAEFIASESIEIPPNGRQHRHGNIDPQIMVTDPPSPRVVAVANRRSGAPAQLTVHANNV